MATLRAMPIKEHWSTRPRNVRDAVFGRPVRQLWGTSSTRSKILVGTASAFAFVLCWWAGKFFHVPTFKGFSASLLTQPAWLTSVLIVAVTFAICAGIGMLIAGRVRPDAGVVVACLGWLAFTTRGGPMRTTLQSDPNPGLFLILIVEMIILAIIASVVAATVRYLRQTRELEEVVESELEHHEVSIAYKVTALIFQTVVMGVIVWLLGQSDLKPQALLSVGIAAFTATALAGEAFDSKRMDFWYFTGPTVVAVVGYLLAFFDPGGIRIGYIDQPLARAMPLDYASAGYAGAILGSWMGELHPLETINSIVHALTGQTPLPKHVHRPAPPAA
jgi:hypothetical protein